MIRVPMTDRMEGVVLKKTRSRTAAKTTYESRDIEIKELEKGTSSTHLSIHSNSSSARRFPL